MGTTSLLTKHNMPLGDRAADSRRDYNRTINSLVTVMLPTSTPQQQTIELGEQGNIVLPESIRHHLNLQPGKKLILTLEPDGSLRLTSLRTQIQNLQGIYKDIAPGRSLAEELIQERQVASSNS